ncbi:MAG: 4Fe-4S binding protein [Methanosphaera sp.]|nr:4Fe-4S binding protein [Methanosphaera sp.]
MRIIWAITGAGHLLNESIDVLDKISYKHEITLTLSRAACEVIQVYGLRSRIETILKRNSNNKCIKDNDEAYSYPFSGKLTHNKYNLIIVSPTTANTTAKIVHGIADTLITNIIAQSGKGQIPLLVMPVDQKEGLIKTVIPPYINKDKCMLCSKCSANTMCPVSAINPPSIDSTICIGCKKCSDSCPYNAIITDEVIELYIRHVDAMNTKMLDTIENITTVLHPNKILEYIEKIE